MCDIVRWGIERLEGVVSLLEVGGILELKSEGEDIWQKPQRWDEGSRWQLTVPSCAWSFLKTC